MILLRPFSILFGLAIEWRNRLYRRGLLPVQQISVPVISVGNLTVGGTGKTPICDLLLGGLGRRGWSPAMVSRGYGRSGAAVERVVLGGELAGAADHFGDEPTLLAWRHPKTAVWVGTPRVEACRRAAEEGARCLVVDDGFQHRRLGRRVDIVLVDLTEPLWHYRLLPEGRAREPLNALRRADMIIFTKTNLVSPEVLSERRLFFEQEFRKLSVNVPVFEVTYHIHSCRHLVGFEEQELSLWTGKRAVLVSGIGRPEAFEASLAGHRLTICEHLRYEDHRAYSHGDLETMARRFRENQADVLIMTEKDAVKLSNLIADVPQLRELSDRIWVAQLRIQVVQGEERFYEAILRNLAHH